MYIENISTFLKEQLPLKLKFLEGNTIFGQIITLEDGKGAIKLYDGTIIPAIFINEDKLEKNKYTKFVIQNFNGEQMVLKAYTLENQSAKEQSLENILDGLNIPYEKGKDIIMSLIKFNLPATDENIMNVYKNINFIDIIRNMDDGEILKFLQKNINPDINKDSKEFLISKDIFSNLKDINSELLSFLKENNLPLNLSSILNTKEFIENKFYFNSLIDELKNTFVLNKAASSMDTSEKLQPFIESSTPLEDKNLKITLDQVINKLDFDKKLISSLKKIIGSDEKPITITSLNDVIKSLSKDANLIKNLPTEIQSKLFDNINVLGHLNENYSFYFFNLYNNSNSLRNAIIVKNKYKSSRYIDINDVKTFITIDTSRLGTVDGYLYKKNNDLIISIKIQKQFVSLVKNNLSLLKNSLSNKGYNVIDISVEARDAKENLSSLSNFFSDGIFKELDVRV